MNVILGASDSSLRSYSSEQINKPEHLTLLPSVPVITHGVLYSHQYC